MDFKEHLWAYIQTSLGEEKLEPDEQRELLAFLGNTTMRKALAICYLRARQIPLQLLNVDLGTSAGINQAATMQGEVRGIVHFLETLLSLIEETSDGTERAE